MAFQGVQLPTADIPQLHRTIGAGAGQGLAIRRKTHTSDTTRMAFQGVQSLFTLFPKFHRSISARGGN